MTPFDEQRFDVALSFAGEDRAFVREVATLLRDAGVSLFYDDFSVVETWGANLLEVFSDIYSRRSRFAVLFVSRYYVNKPWPRHERQSAQSRALAHEAPYVLPVRLDDTAVPGMPWTVGYVDARRLGPGEVAELIKAKLDLGSEEASESVLLGVPRSGDDVIRLLATRPPAWEPLLYAGLLSIGKRSAEAKWRDHRLRLRRPGGNRLSDRAATDRLVTATTAPVTAIENLNRSISPEAQAYAFGEPSGAGDPEEIEHLARTFMRAYEDLLDWAMDIRSLVVSDEIAGLRDITARMADRALDEIRSFIDDAVQRADRVPALLLEPGDEPVELTLHLVLTFDDDLLREHQAELKRLRRLFRKGFD